MQPSTEVSAPTNWIVRVLPDKGQLTKHQLTQRATQVANLLTGRKISRVAILTENRLECAELMLGARWAGADYLICGTDHLLTGVRLSNEALKGIIEDFGAAMIIISDTHRATATWLSKHLTGNIQLLMMGHTTKGWESYELARDSQPSAPIKERGQGEFYPLSGGSSGRPKVIKTPVQLDGQPAAMQTLMFPGPDGVMLVAGPLYHNLHARALLAALVSGRRAVILSHWDAHLFLRAIEEQRVSHTNVIPMMMVRLLQLSAAERKRYDVTSLKQVLHTAGPCPEDIKRQCISWLGNRLVEAYGMTERFGGTHINAAEWLQRPGSVGRALPGCRIAIRNEAGKQLPPGETGLIWFGQAHKQSRMEYLGDPDGSAACYNDLGEATVRDVGYMDADGYLYITGRAKRMIDVGGVNVYPESTEKLLADQTGITDVWVFGRSDRIFGERLCAFVQLRSKEQRTPKLAAQLTRLCRARLGDYAAPDRIIFVDSLPRNEAGKMDPKRIAAMEAEVFAT